MTREIPLTRGVVALVDDEDYAAMSAVKWFAHPSRRTNGDMFWYAARMIPGRKDHERGLLMMHRVILNVPKGLVVDHIDGNGVNNTRANLRICTQAENMRNIRLRSDSRNPHKGVQWRPHANAYGVRVTVNHTTHWVGYFKDPEEAARARDEAAKRLHGEFARLNLPKGEAA